MFNEKLKKRIAEVWNAHVSDLHREVDEEGNSINNIDDGRLYAIEIIKIIIHNFMKGDFNVIEFKNALDSYNKHNNLWGYSAKFGQMYFNQLIKANETNLDKLGVALKDLIIEPRNLKDALSKIDTLEKMTQGIYSKAKDKHNAPYPGATGYFLSYFWQIYNHQKWPILYNNLISSFKEFGIWEDQKTQKETYEVYYRVYNEVKDVVEDEVNRPVSFWEVEHAFWNYKFKPVISVAPAEIAAAAVSMPKAQLRDEPVKVVTDQEAPPVRESFNAGEYVIPRFARLGSEEFVNADDQKEEEFADLVAELFSHLDLEVFPVIRGELSDATAVIKCREKNTAIILDARTSGHKYLLADRRAVKDYVNEQCEALARDEYRKVVYLVVADNFELKYQNFVSYVQWNCDIKKMTLMSTAALLQLLAYKLQYRVKGIDLFEKICNLSDVVNTSNIQSELGI